MQLICNKKGKGVYLFSNISTQNVIYDSKIPFLHQVLTKKGVSSTSLLSIPDKASFILIVKCHYDVKVIIFQLLLLQTLCVLSL